MRKSRKTLIIAGAVVAAVLAGGTAAYAYWTTTGSGSGTAGTGDVQAVTINQTGTIAGLKPGGAAQTISGTFDNPNDGPVYIAQLTVAIDTVTKAAGAPAGTCDASDYALTNPTVTIGEEIPAGTGVHPWTGPTIQFNNKAGTNQDACKGATVAFAFTSN